MKVVVGLLGIGLSLMVWGVIFSTGPKRKGKR